MEVREDLDNSCINISDIRELSKLTIVEMPCFVTNAEKGIEILGGVQNIQRAISSKVYDPYSLVAKIPEGNPLKQGLLSQRLTCSGLLVKVKRKKNTNANLSSTLSNIIVSCEVLGRVTNKITFSMPDDFQVVTSYFLLISTFQYTINMLIFLVSTIIYIFDSKAQWI